MDQSEITGLKTRIWRRLSKTLSKESVVQAAKTIQRAAVMFFGCRTKRFDVEDGVSTTGAPKIWTTGASQREIMEYYKKKIFIFDDGPIISNGGDGLSGTKNKDPVDEKEEATIIVEQKKKETEENGVTDIIRQIEQNRWDYDARERQKTHTERLAGRTDHNKCCLGWDYIYGRRHCVGTKCQGPPTTYLEDTTDTMLSNIDESDLKNPFLLDMIKDAQSRSNASCLNLGLDESDLTNPFLLDIIKDNKSSSRASCLDFDLDENDLANPFILDMIKERLSAGGMSGGSVSASGDGIDLSKLDEVDLSNPFLIDVIKEGGF